MSRILILPAGWEQAPLLRAAKAAGHWVLAVDADASAEGAGIADAFAQASPRDLERLLALAREHRIEAVATDECDYSVYAAAWLAARLGLPGPSLRAGLAGTNKRVMRELCRRAGIRQPAFAACRDLEEAKAAARRIGLPVVVKPVDNRGAFGVGVVRRASELEAAFLSAVAHSHARECLVERYIPGTVLTVEGFGFGRRHKALAASSKTMLAGSHPIATRLIYPADLPPAALRAVLANHERVAKACGYLRGPTHGEYILDAKGGLHLVEIANRGSGVLVSPLALPVLSGLDVNGAILDLAMGRLPSLPKAGERGAVALGFLIFPPGRVSRFQGLDSVRARPEVLDARVWARTGQDLPPSINAATRHGLILTRGTDPAAALRAAEEARASIEAVYEDGRRAPAMEPGAPR